MDQEPSLWFGMCFLALCFERGLIGLSSALFPHLCFVGLLFFPCDIRFSPHRFRRLLGSQQFDKQIGPWRSRRHIFFLLCEQLLNPFFLRLAPACFFTQVLLRSLSFLFDVVFPLGVDALLH